MEKENSILVEVVYAGAEQQWLLEVRVEQGATVQQAIDRSGILEKAGLSSVEAGDVGVFSRKVSLDAPLENGDRVEIYRPLLLTPNEIRKLRAERKGRRETGKRSAGD